MPSPSITQHSSPRSSIELQERSETSAAGAARNRPGSPAADVRSLPSGSFPQVQPDSDAIGRVVDDIISEASRHHPSAPQLETVHAAPAQVAQLRTALLDLPANTRNISRLATQFQLEGVALRAMVTNREDLEKLGSGELLNQSMADKLPRELRELLSRDAVYDTINTQALNTVAQPYPDHELALAGITGSPSQLAAHRVALMDDAFKGVLQHIEADCTPEQIADVKLAHQAFLVGVAEQKNVLEVSVLNLKVKEEIASNEILALPGTRARNKQEVKDELTPAETALAEFSKGSNVVLQQAYEEELNHRTIAAEDPFVSKLPETARQGLVGGSTQGIVSGATWGVASNIANTYGKKVTGDLAPVAGAVASQVIRATALGVSHKLMSDGPRDMFQALFELGGWARPPELSSPAQLYPDARRSMLDADCRPHPAAAATADAEDARIKQKRQDFVNQSKKYTFGNVSADNNGQSSFGEVNAGRDVLNSVGLNEVNSLTGRSVTSTLGGIRMSTVGNMDMLKLRIDGKPAFAPAKRPNPRTIATRLVTGMKKLNLAEAENRVDLLSKIASAAIGMIVAEAMDKLLSQPLQAAIDSMDDGGKKLAAQSFGLVAHAGIEYAKSYATLGGFFSGPPAKEEAKTAPGRNAGLQRFAVGFDNVAHPTKRTTAYESGTLGYKRQVANNLYKGLNQAVAQPVAITLEGLTFGAPSTVKAAVEITKEGYGAAKEGYEAGKEGAKRMLRNLGGSSATPAPQANDPAGQV